MKNINITNLRMDEEAAGLVTPDYLYNRFDIIYPNDYCVLSVEVGDKTTYIPIHTDSDIVHMGIQLATIDEALCSELTNYIFSADKQVKKIVFSNTLVRPEKGSESTYYVLELPQTVEELRNRMTTKSHYNMRRLKRIINDEFGGYTLTHFSRDSIPNELIETYFQMKSQTHTTGYGEMSPETYLNTYHVTDAYTLTVGTEFSAILFSCEQCKNVYLENLTYDVALSKYSVGTVLYDEFVQRMIEKGKRAVMLGGGNLDYKKKYGSMAVQVFNGVVYRNKLSWIADRLKVRMGKS